MATALYLKNTTLNGITDAAIAALIYDMTTGAAASVDTAVTDTAASGTEIQLTKTAGGSTVAWVSGRAPAGGFTLTATDISAWQHESHMNANIGGRYSVYKYSGGTLTALDSLPPAPGGRGLFDDGVEMATSAREDVWTGNVADTAFAENDRIVVKLFLTNIGAMGGGFTGTLTFNAADAAIGDSFFNIAETVTFKAEANSGTSAVTLAEATSSASGKVTVKGTSTVTLDAASSSASGKVTVTGTTGVTLADFTSSASGTVQNPTGVTGTSAVTLANATSSASGKVSIVGSSGVALADYASTASGKVASLGTSGVTLEPFISSATGNSAGAPAVVADNFLAAYRELERVRHGFRRT